MSGDGPMPAGGGAPPQGEVDVVWVKLSRSRVKLEVRWGHDLVHAHVLDVRNAKARADFAAAVAEKLEARGAPAIGAEEIDGRLLAIVDELGQVDEDVAPTGPRYRIVEDDADPERNGIFTITAEGLQRLCTFGMLVLKDTLREDGGETRRVFEGRITLDGKSSAFVITPEEFANGRLFMAAVFTAAGPRARFLAHPDAVRAAVSALSRPSQEKVTNSLGYDESGTEFRFPSGRVDATGIHGPGDGDPVRVDLSGEDCARHLDLAAPGPGELPGLKEHVVEELLRLTDRTVTFLLLGAVALSALIRFVPAMNRPALWLVGLTGSGKSFLGRLFANFHGDFPVELGSRLASWSSTGNYLQRMGWFFKDALFFIDDFKQELARLTDYVKVMQNYADGSTRGRLRSDATSNVVRPIRGILVSTAEDVPEGSASALARNVVVAMPNAPKDRARGQRCVRRCHRYRALHAAFIHHLIAAGRTADFADRVEGYRDRFLSGIEGRQNDLRIAGNLALFAAAFAEYAAFLGDVWPGWQAELEAFVVDLEGLRDRMLADVSAQQPSEIFLEVLRVLVRYGVVRVVGLAPPEVPASPPGAAATATEHRPTIGRVVTLRNRKPETAEIATFLAMQAVQQHLRQAGRPELAATARALLGQLADDGKLLDRDGRTLGPGASGRATWAAKVDGGSRRVFRIAIAELVGEADSGDIAR